MDLLDLYFTSNRYFVTKHHLESYNEFANSMVKKVVQSMNPFTVHKNGDDGNLKYEIALYVGGLDADELFFTKCTIKDRSVPDGVRLLYPNECRLKNMS